MFAEPLIVHLAKCGDSLFCLWMLVPASCADWMLAGTTTLLKATVGIYVVLCQLFEPIVFLARHKVLASFAVVEGMAFVQAVAKKTILACLPATIALYRFAGLLLRALFAFIGLG